MQAHPQATPAGLAVAQTSLARRKLVRTEALTGITLAMIRGIFLNPHPLLEKKKKGTLFPLIFYVFKFLSRFQSQPSPALVPSAFTASEIGYNWRGLGSE